MDRKSIPVVERDWPEDIIHRIQSFLPGKDAARTCLLSKSWHNAWSTRPVLWFDEQDFDEPTNGRSPEFLNFMRNSIQRYRDLGLKIDKLVFRMDFSESVKLRAPLADEIVTGALALCVNELDFTFGQNWKYALPAKVFATTSLTKLSVEGCRVLPFIEGALLGCRLVSLRLNNVDINKKTMQDILRGCPAIKKLDICGCYGIKILDVANMHNLVKFRVYHRVIKPGLDLYVNFGPGLANHAQFPSLRVMSLNGVFKSNMFLAELASRFPCIQKLNLDCIFGYEDIRISSNSLKYLRLNLGYYFKTARLDVPNARVVEFMGNNRNVKCSKRPNEADLSCIELEVNYLMDISESGFKLEFMVSVTKNSPFNVFLRNFVWKNEISWKDGQTFRDLVSALMSRCHDNSSEQNYYTRWYPCSYSFLWVLQKMCFHRTQQNCLDTSHDMICLNDSEQVRVELFDKNSVKWRNIDLDKLVDTLLVRCRPEIKKRFEFRFRWEVDPSSDPDYVFVG